MCHPVYLLSARLVRKIHHASEVQHVPRSRQQLYLDKPVYLTVPEAIRTSSTSNPFLASTVLPFGVIDASQSKQAQMIFSLVNHILARRLGVVGETQRAI